MRNRLSGHLLQLVHTLSHKLRINHRVNDGCGLLGEHVGNWCNWCNWCNWGLARARSGRNNVIEVLEVGRGVGGCGGSRRSRGGRTTGAVLLLDVVAVLRGNKTLFKLLWRVVTLELTEKLFYNFREGTTLVRDVPSEALVGIFKVLPRPAVTRLGLCQNDRLEGGELTRSRFPYRS
jgi:hypothetical protein